jgi:hypothetical protein
LESSSDGSRDSPSSRLGTVPGRGLLGAD